MSLNRYLTGPSLGGKALDPGSLAASRGRDPTGPNSRWEMYPGGLPISLDGPDAAPQAPGQGPGRRQPGIIHGAGSLQANRYSGIVRPG